jgi:hypothetical protein
MVEQNLCPPPVRSGLDPCDLDLPGGAQAAIHRVDHHLDVRSEEAATRRNLGTLDDDVIAALGFERQPVADRGADRGRVGTGRDHGPVAGDVSGGGVHGLQAAALDDDGARRCCHEPCPERGGMGRQRGDIGARIATAAGFLDQDSEAVSRMEMRLALAQLFGRQLQPVDADAPADVPGEAVGLEDGARSVNLEQALALDQLRATGFGREPRMQSGSILEQAAQRDGRPLQLGRRPPRPETAQQPRPHAR